VPDTRQRLIAVSAAVLLAAGAASLSGIAPQAAAPATIALPNNGVATETWPGTVAAGAGNAPGAANLRCTTLNPTSDITNLTVTGPAGYYTTHTASLTIRIDWTPVVNDTVNDLGMTVIDTPNGGTTEYFDAHQQGSKSESVTILNPHPDIVYAVGVCADANAAAQTYTATASLAGAPLGVGGATFSASTVQFGAASIVSPVFLGGEPQATIERPQPNSVAGAVDPNRVFIDWPLSTRSQIGQLYRSNNHGDTFMPLIDVTCLPRSRPNCQTGGGGDTINRVNFYDGSVFFGDQEALAQESFASSTDHGDSWPANRQFAVNNATSAVDRQWIAPINAPGVTGGPNNSELRAIYSYHIPVAGEYIQGVDANGLLIPQPVPQVLSVSQSGPSRFDTTGGPGNNWIYQGYRDGTGFRVAVSPVATYHLPSSWSVGTVSTDIPTIFPWINLDTHGNLYAAWVTGGQLYYSYSLIDDAANDPAKGGTPATKWAPKIQVNLPSIKSAVFPEIVAGSPGKVAILYMGTPDGPGGVSDNAPADAKWNVYTAFVTGALSAAPTVSTGKVNHRVAHVGSICTSGTTCTGDRSLLDMIDLQYDSQGHVGVVFSDNNSSFGTATGTAPAKGGPFQHYAREIVGPSLLDSGSAINQTAPSVSITSAAGDARWPNTATGTNLKALDLTGASLTIDSTNHLVGTMTLNEATVSAIERDLATYNAVLSNSPNAVTGSRVQYLLRFSSGAENYYLSMDVNASGAIRYFGGKLDGTGDTVTNGSSTLGARYPAKATYSGTLSGTTITITAPAADFGLAKDSPLYSVQAFTMAGPAEGTDNTIADPMRQIDATPPFDTILGAPATNVAEAPLMPALVLAGVLATTAAVVRRRRRLATL
jgi:hypothetical protein